MASRKIRIGIIGCGTIGSQLVKAIDEKFSHQAELFALCDTDKEKAQKLERNSSSTPEILSIDELINNCDLVIEAASGKISYEVAQKTLEANKDVMLMSIGGILGRHQALFSLARSKGCRIHLPSGAIGGLDAVKAASMAKINSATLITRKPPQGLAGAPYLAQKKIDLAGIKEETVVFEGLASEAVKGFPKNVNVCAVLSLAATGAQKTRVKIITSPEYTANSHEIELEGDFGKLLCRTVNVPSPVNPKTSFLAALSAIATLKNVLDVVKIGT